MPEIRKPYEEYKHEGLKCRPNTLVQQHFKDEVNINNIMAKAVRTGFLPQKSAGSYGDFTNAYDFQSAQNKIIEAQNAFEALPANIRSRFRNEPANLIEFVNNSENYDEAVELGLIEHPAKAEKTPAEGQATQSLT